MKFFTNYAAKEAIFHQTRRRILEKSQRLSVRIGWVETCVINPGKLINGPLSALETWHENWDGWRRKIRASCIINSDKDEYGYVCSMHIHRVPSPPFSPACQNSVSCWAVYAEQQSGGCSGGQMYIFFLHLRSRRPGTSRWTPHLLPIQIINHYFNLQRAVLHHEATESQRRRGIYWKSRALSWLMFDQQSTAHWRESQPTVTTAERALHSDLIV